MQIVADARFSRETLILHIRLIVCRELSIRICEFELCHDLVNPVSRRQQDRSVFVDKQLGIRRNVGLNPGLGNRPRVVVRNLDRPLCSLRQRMAECQQQQGIDDRFSATHSLCDRDDQKRAGNNK